MNYRGDNPQAPGSGAAAGADGHIDAWAELAVDYLDGTANDAVRDMIDGHLAACPECAARMNLQRSTVSLLSQIEMAAVPDYLEDRVLGEFLFPSRVVARPQPEKIRWTQLLERRLRPWLPATVAVAAVLIGLVAWGVFNPMAEEQTTAKRDEGTTAVASATGAADSAETESALGAAPADTTAGAMTTAAPAPGGATTTAAAATTLNAAEAPPEPVPTTIQDRRAMVAALKEASGPLYLAFTPTPTETDGSDANPGTSDGAGGAGSGTGSTTGADGTDAATGEGSDSARDAGTAAGEADPQWVQDVIEQVTTFTELQPVPASLSPDGAVFAAYLDHDNVSAFVDLLRSIAASFGLQVSLQNEPDPDGHETADRIAENKRMLPVLVGHVIPQPAPYRYGFTTSTLATDGSGEGENGARTVLPDDAGTHVLTVVFMRP